VALLSEVRIHKYLRLTFYWGAGQEGGLTGWVGKAGDEPARTRAYLVGNLILAVVRNKRSD
jgi:hypothetical protein